MKKEVIKENKVAEGGEKSSKRQKSFWLLGLLLVGVVVGSVVFVGAVAGWFGGNSRVMLSEEFVCKDKCEQDFVEISISEYEQLIADGKSFVIFIDQDGCHTADKLREFIKTYVDGDFVVQKMMFSEMKKTSLHDFVKFYPSVAIISNGKVVAWLRADSDDDGNIYNDYEAFKNWLENHLQKLKKS